MKKTINHFLIALVIASLCALPPLGSSSVQAQDGFPPTLEPSLSADGMTLYNGVLPLVVIVDPDQSTQGIQSPAEPDLEAAIADPEAASATFTIDYKAAGATDPWGASCQTFPTAAKTAFNKAASIWANTIKSSVPIKISACWSNLGSSSILGYSGGEPLHRNFSGATKSNTWYMGALANSLAGSDLSTSSYDDYITYNSNFTWYYGTDGNPPAGQYDLVTVAAHEIGHGLNFAGSASYSSGNGYWGESGYPVIYDTFMESNGGTKVTSYTSGSTSLGSLYTSNSLWFNGTNANAANGGSRVKMYAPSSWSSGSSYSHLDYNTFKGTSNSMMVYAVSSGSSQHNPGAVTKGILKDMGWKMASTSTSTTPTPQSPSGTISDKTPTYKWTKVAGATKYRFQLMKGSSTVYTKTVSSSACGSSICSNTPTKTLSYAKYKWRVQALVGGAWKSYSAFKTFTVAAPATGFNSQFTSDATGWSPVNGSWSVSGGYYQTGGLTEKFTTSKYNTKYSKLTYEVRLRRTGCSSCSQGIYFNGTPSPINSTGRWNKGYAMYIANNQYFTIGMYSGNTWTSLLDWTSYSGINSSLNTIKVTYNSSTGYVQFYINGTRVAYGTFSTYTSGNVGVGFYRDTSSGNKLYVDWAKLSMSAPASSVAEDGLAAALVEGDGIYITDEVTSNATTLGGPDMMVPEE